MQDWTLRWQPTIEAWVTAQMSAADAGHGIDHVRRVVENAKKIGGFEGANPNIYLPAAWLHDCVFVPKNSEHRSKASTLAAESAKAYLQSIRYPEQHVNRICHCIQAHSFSANIECESIEARVVQDSDRLEALGAIGLARCLMTGGAMGQRLYHPEQPFPVDRQPKDNEQSVDHFFSKLLGLHRTMQTQAGRDEAKRRTVFLIDFLRQLATEIHGSCDELERSFQRWGQPI
ncbi:MAG: HD domain-containing protein [Pirellula sp.]